MTRDSIADRFNSALSDEGGTGAQYRVAESDIASARVELARWKGQQDSAAPSIRDYVIERYPSEAVNASASNSY